MKKCRGFSRQFLEKLSGFSIKVDHKKIYLFFWTDQTKYGRLLHMKTLAYTLLALALSACSSAPTLTVRPDGSMFANLGASLAENTDEEVATLRMPNGAEMTYAKKAKGQTKGLTTLIGWYFASDMFANATAAASTITKNAYKASTTKALSADKVAVKEIEAKTAETAILNPPTTTPAP